jgi:hypothetical protein
MELIIALFLVIFVVGVFTITEILLKRVTKYIERYHPYSILELLMIFVRVGIYIAIIGFVGNLLGLIK